MGYRVALLTTIVLSAQAMSWAKPGGIVRLAMPHSAASPKLDADALIAPLLRAAPGTRIDIAAAATDVAGNLYLTGTSLVEVDPSRPPVTVEYSAVSVLAAKFDPSGEAVYVLTIGGKGNDYGLGIAADAAGDAFIVGNTTSPDFPLLSALQTDVGSQAGFILKLSPTGELMWSTFFGGVQAPFPIVPTPQTATAQSTINGIAVDGAGNAYVAGSTNSNALITTTGAFQTADDFFPNGFVSTRVGFVAEFGPSGTLVYSTYLGGSSPFCYGGSGCLGLSLDDAPSKIAVDSAGVAYIAGLTNSFGFPTTPGAYQTACYFTSGEGPFPAVPFLVKMDTTGAGLLFGTYLCGTIDNQESAGTPQQINALAVDAGGYVYVAGSAANAKFPTTSGALQTQLSGAQNAFLTKFDATGSLVLSTLLGGSGSDSATALAVGADGSMLLAGTTSSSDFPDGAGVFPTGSNFVTRLDATASQVLNAVRVPGGVADAALLSPSGTAIIAAGTSGLVSQLVLDGKAEPIQLGAGNAATPGMQSAVVGGSAISIYGIGLSAATASIPALNGELQTSWQGLQVLINGQPVPLLYVSPTQINAVTETIPEGGATVEIVNNNTPAGSFAVGVQLADPQIFRAVDGSALAINQDGTVNSAAHPAPPDSILAVWGTGFTFPGDPGAVVAVADNYSGVFGTSGLVDYFGPAPTLPLAIFQLNFTVPNWPGPIQLPLYPYLSGIGNQTTTVWVGQ